MLRLDLRKYKDACTLVKEIITVTYTNNNSRQSKKLIFKNNATFRSCTEKNNNTFIDNGNYSITSVSMWHY